MGFPATQSSEYGTYKTFMARFWPWLYGKRPENVHEQIIPKQEVLKREGATARERGRESVEVPDVFLALLPHTVLDVDLWLSFHAVKNMWHIKDSHSQILAMAFKV